MTASRHRHLAVATRLGAAAFVLVMFATAALANFAGTDVFIPSLGFGPGASNSQWNACIWVHNPNPAPVNVTFRLLLRDQANLTPQAFNDTIPAGDTRRYEDAFATLFGVNSKTFGAVRVTTPAGQPVIVNARSYSTPASGGDKDTTGQFYAAIPASFAIGQTQKTQLLGVFQTTPQTDSDFRYNYGFVETTGHTASVLVTAMDETGATVGSKNYSLAAYQASQYNITDLLPTVNASNLRLEVAVTSGPGQVVAFGSGIANWSNDPSTFEMSFRDELLAANSASGLTAVAHDATLTGDGTTTTPLGVANGGVTDSKVANGIAYSKLSGAPASLPPSGAAGGSLSGTYPSPGIAPGAVGSAQLGSSAVTADKVSAAGSFSGQVLSSNGSAVSWKNQGLTLPYSGTVASGGNALAVANTGNGPTIAATAISNDAVYGLSGSNGVHGTSTGGTGVYGNSTSGYGVKGQSSSGDGVFGYSVASHGVDAESGNGVAIHANCDNSDNSVDLGGPTYALDVSGKARITASSGVNTDIFTVTNSGGGRALRLTASTDTALWATSTSGIGVDARSSSGNGINATSTTGYAGYFTGKVNVTGMFTKGGGAFKIDHPLDPEHKYLYHSFVESPDMMNIYNGNVVTDADGRAVVELPDWFSALNRDFRYQLTVIGRFAQAIVEEEIEGNRFVIRTNLAKVKVSWQVTGIRRDPFANANRIPVEEVKPDAEQGSYLHPAAYGQPEEKSLGWALDTAVLRNTKEEPDKATTARP